MDLGKRSFLYWAGGLVASVTAAKAQQAGIIPTTLTSPTSVPGLGQQLDYLNTHQAAVEAAGALPSSLGSLLSLELYAHRGVFDANGAAITADSTLVKTWTDTRSGGFSGTQNTAANQPTWIKNAYNALPALRFNGNQVLSVPDDVSLRPDSGQFRVFVVARTNTAKLSCLLAKGNNASTVQGYSFLTDYAFPTVTTYVRCSNSGGTGRGSQGLAGIDNTVKLIDFYLDGSTITGFMNGSNTSWTSGGEGPASNTYTAPISNTDALLIGASSTPVYSYCDIFAVLVFKGTLTADQVAMVRRYLSTLYANAAPAAVAYNTASETTLWTSGVDHAGCRIPAIVRCNNGTLLAFSEARAGGSGTDNGQISIVMKRSTNGGVTWSSETTVRSDGTNTCQNAAPIVHRGTGRVHLLSCWNLGTDSETTIVNGTSAQTRKVYYQYSDDSGVTWSTALDISTSVKNGTMRWFTTGPGNSEQLANGRLLVACDHSDPAYVTNTYKSNVIYSDDNGATWNLGGIANLEGTNESSVAQLPSGTIVLSMRYQPGGGLRYFSTSTDNGATWTTPTSNPTMTVPVCEGDVLAIGSTLVHMAPYSVSNTRTDLTARVSTDGGVTWPASTLVHSGTSAYSDQAIIANGSTLGLIYEQGSGPNLVFGTFTVAYPKWTT